MNTRRKFLLGGLGVIGAGAAGLWLGKNQILKSAAMLINNEGKVASAAPAFEANCVLTADATDGPFFVRSAIRSDIRDGKPGKEFKLRLKLSNASDCTPVRDATVEIWHCDADGIYSGYPEDMSRDIWSTLRFVNFSDAHVEPVNEKRFLRGAQVTDSDGVCEFTTILPGWYEGRAPHIHMKVFAGDRAVFSTQLFMNEELTKRVYTALEPYSKYGDSPFNMKNDIVISEMKEHTGVLLDPVWNDSGPLVASAKIGLKFT
jgi:protocatechuate 3,4-dioxygenase beta subunit